MEVILCAGNLIDVTHCLGGYYTVRGIFGAAKIADSDSDAIYPDAVKSGDQAPKPFPYSTEDSPELSDADLWNVAKTVYDPEIPVNIVDLGLVYRMEIKKDGNANNIEADMTLTAAGCAMGPVIAEELRSKLESLPGVSGASVNIVWDPPWNQDMMTEEARMILGLA